MVSRWSFAFSRKSLEDVLRRHKQVLKKVTTSISDQSKTFLRPKLRRFYDVFVSAGLLKILVGGK